LFSAMFGFIAYISQHKDYRLPEKAKASIAGMFSYLIPIFFLLALYFTFLFEITAYFDSLYYSTKMKSSAGYSYNYSLHRMESIWTINYTLFFVFVLSLVNVKFLKNITLGYVSIGLSVLAMLTFLTQGIDVLSSLQYNYLNPSNPEVFPPSKMHVGLRYLSYPFVGLLLYSTYLVVKEFKLNPQKELKIGFDLLLHVTLLALVSFELVQWMEFSQSSQSYKLGLSILWGIYALVLIVLGIWKKKKHLRLMAIGLFAFTLLKLFFYDISHLNTIAKTVVFLALGILLLIVSFLYTKYKDVIIDEDEN